MNEYYEHPITREALRASVQSAINAHGFLNAAEIGRLNAVVDRAERVAYGASCIGFDFCIGAQAGVASFGSYFDLEFPVEDFDLQGVLVVT
jgi:hypothetical protein